MANHDNSLVMSEWWNGYCERNCLKLKEKPKERDSIKDCYWSFIDLKLKLLISSFFFVMNKRWSAKLVTEEREIK